MWLPIGIPVAANFLDVNEDIDVPHDKKRVLLTSGSMGFGEMKECVHALLNNVDCYLIVVCGSNAELKNELDKINNDNLYVLGFINNMNQYMKSSDVIIAKPGGLTSTEITMMRKPFVIMMPIPGVENYNARFFSENGMGLNANSVDEVVLNTKRLLEDKILRENMIENQKKYINDKSASDLVQYVKKWM